MILEIIESHIDIILFTELNLLFKLDLITAPIERKFIKYDMNSDYNLEDFDLKSKSNSNSNSISINSSDKDQII